MYTCKTMYVSGQSTDISSGSRLPRNICSDQIHYPMIILSYLRNIKYYPRTILSYLRNIKYYPRTILSYLRNVKYYHSIILKILSNYLSPDPTIAKG